MEAPERKTARITWILATRNLHKLAEIQGILGNDFNYRTLKDFPDFPPVIENAPDFAGNATKKALELASWLAARASSAREAVWTLADDSGLEVDALAGAPGVHSARFAAMDSPASPAANSADDANNAKLLRLLASTPLDKRTARFHCVIAITPVVAPPNLSDRVCHTDEAELRTELFEGVCEGRVALEPRGSGGFGYDPLFVPVGYDRSFAELGEDVKNRLSHRAKALRKLQEKVGRILPQGGGNRA